MQCTAAATRMSLQIQHACCLDRSRVDGDDRPEESVFALDASEVPGDDRLATKAFREKLLQRRNRQLGWIDVGLDLESICLRTFEIVRDRSRDA